MCEHGPVSVPPALAEKVRAWIDGDPDPQTARELEALLERGDDLELGDRFARRLEFGTAGLRAALGAGPNRMNLALVRMTSLAVARWLDATHVDGDVVVGHDARHGSADFARDAAATITAAGRGAVLASGPNPTPLLAFAARKLRAAAAIVVTASHNPAPDNGYKVFDASGSQIIPPSDAEIGTALDDSPPANTIAGEFDAISELPEPVVDAYVATVCSLVSPNGPRNIEIVYTPIHGVAGPLLLRTFAASGFPAPSVVADQADPDPDFPTTPFPNPEEPGVLDLAIDQADTLGADLVLANDPDGDRLGVAVPAPGGWRNLSGDEIGVLLGARRLERTDGTDRIVATSIVSARWLERIAARRGVGHRTTLTGFKWVSRAGDHDGHRLVLGYEEALGYAVCDAVRDKDGISAALVLAELAAELRDQGRSLVDMLGMLGVEVGASATRQRAWRFDGSDASERMAALMNQVRAAPPDEVGGRAVRRVDDLTTENASGLPRSDVLVWELEGEARVILRPSGTEPKLKCYLEVIHTPDDDSGDAYERSRAATTPGLLDLETAVDALVAG